MIKRLHPSALKVFKELRVTPMLGGHDGMRLKSEPLTSRNPHDGTEMAQIIPNCKEECKARLEQIARHSHSLWETPMPRRGEVLRQVGEALREHKHNLATVISLETGKIITESLGEVQEFIDMCDFACGLSRQIGGLVLPSERKSHSIMEYWHPLGIVGVISAFNFPAAVFGWNFCLSFLCGNATIWKAAPSTPLTTYALTELIREVLRKNHISEHAFDTFYGGKEIGQLLVSDKSVSLLSFTGSTEVGREVGVEVQRRFGKSLLELGGNNAVIVSKEADLQLALKACAFSAVGTAGQRCTSLRRLFIHEDHYENFKRNLVGLYENFKIGDPMDPASHIGPLHSQSSVESFLYTLEKIQAQGGKIITGGDRLSNFPGGNYVRPTIVEISHESEIVKTESFSPILYLFKFKTLDEAIRMANNVPQGLSGSLFTQNMKEMFRFVGPLGSHTGLANINVGTSGAEIGGAFGGEKETGGGRESGSDSWKQYMRRLTCTVNFGNDLPLSQGIDFEIKLNP